MKKAIATLLVGVFFLALGSWSGAATDAIAPGEQPQISIDNKAVIRVVYGLNDKIFCSTSGDQGIHFSKPVLVAQLPDMHLGMSRGPQSASSAGYSIISAMDKSGDIHRFRLSHVSGIWKAMGMINDLNRSPLEGQTGDSLKLVRLSQKKEIPVGTGSFLRSIILSGNKMLCVWEQDKIIKFRKV